MLKNVISYFLGNHEPMPGILCISRNTSKTKENQKRKPKQTKNRLCQLNLQ